MSRLDNHTLKKYVEKKDYTRLETMLDGVTYNDDRLLFNVLKLIRNMKEIENKEYYGLPKVDYTSSELSGFDRFYTAINKKDFMEAYKLTTDCINYLERKGKSTFEMEIYQKVLEDVVKVQKRKLRIIEGKKMHSISKSLELVDKQYSYFSLEYINRLEQIISKYKVTIVSYTDKQEHFKNFDKILFAIKNAINDEQTNNNNFKATTFLPSDGIEQFLGCVKLENYSTAYMIAKNKCFKEEMSQQEDKVLYEIYIKLLTVLNEILIYNRQKDKFELKQVLPNEKVIEQELERAIQEGDIKRAKQYLIEYNLILKDHKKVRKVHYYQYQIDVIEQLKKDGQYEKWIQFQDKVKQVSGRNSKDVRYFIRKHKNNPEFEHAMYYFLEGKLEETAHNFNAAKRNYEKSISICMSPEACFRLGSIYYYMRNYKQAFVYFRLYEAFYPHQKLKNIENLIDVYHHLGKDEKAVQYEQVANRLRSIHKHQ